MRLVNMSEFLALPEGTIFRESYRDQPDDELCVKVRNFGENDFIAHALIVMDYNMGENPEFNQPLTFDETYRDGCFDFGEHNRKFMVLDTDDMIKLHEYIGSLL